jgi:hypothetical protein
MKKLIAFVLFLLSSTAYAENRDRIVVIDTGLNFFGLHSYLCEDGHLDLTGFGMSDVNGHGTNIVGILVKKMNTKTQCIQVIKWMHDFNQMIELAKKDIKAADNLFATALDQAIKYKAKYVNMSLSGERFLAKEYKRLEYLTNSGTKVVVAAGNDSKNLDIKCGNYPACYYINNNNWYVVGNLYNFSSNYGSRIKYWEDGNGQEGLGVILSGTSQAAAKFLSKLISQ